MRRPVVRISITLFFGLFLAVLVGLVASNVYAGGDGGGGNLCDQALARVKACSINLGVTDEEALSRCNAVLATADQSDIDFATNCINASCAEGAACIDEIF